MEDDRFPARSVTETSRFGATGSPIFLENHHSTTSTIASAFGVSLNLLPFPGSMAATILDHSHSQGLELKGETQWDPLEKVCRITPPIANSQTYS
jgi:hypothetical protein